MKGNFGYGGSSNYMNDQKMLLADKKKQALRYSYETLGNLLSTAENFGGFPNEKYSRYNITTSYDYQNLKSEFAWELHCFQRARNLFQQKFQCPYQFPTDISQETILKDIKKYMKKTKNPQDIILFNCMINIIKGDKVNIDFEKLFEELDKNANDKINPNKLKGIIGPLNEILDQQLDEADKGNMNLYLFDDKNLKQRKNLKDISERNSQTLQIQIGIEGKLYKQSGDFKYKIHVGSNVKTIKIDNPRFNSFTNDLNPDLYTFDNNKGMIIIRPQKEDNFIKCFIFADLPKNISQDCFTMLESYELEGKNYNFGIITIGGLETNYGLIEVDMK